MRLLRDFADFLRRDWAWWVPLTLLVWAVIVWLAWKEAQVPDSPFTYRF